MISRCIENIVTLSPELFKQRPGAIERTAKCLRQLHQSDVKFDFEFDLFSVIENYLQILKTKNIDLPEGFRETVEAIRPH